MKIMKIETDKKIIIIKAKIELAIKKTIPGATIPGATIPGASATIPGDWYIKFGPINPIPICICICIYQAGSIYI